MNKLKEKTIQEFREKFGTNLWKEFEYEGKTGIQTCHKEVEQFLSSSLDTVRKEIIEKVEKYKKTLEQEKINLLMQDIEDTPNVNHAIGAIRNILDQLKKE